ncbi:MAG: hypothetical protein ACM3X4_05495 [Ignavibacteriales bacterium]
MTHFLSCGFLKDSFLEILESAGRLNRLLESSGRSPDDESRLAAQFIEDRARQATELLDSMTCEPLIWTGTGTTEEVVRRLEELLSAAETAR